MAHHSSGWRIEYGTRYAETCVSEHDLVVFRGEGKTDQGADREEGPEDNEKTASIRVKVSSGEE